MISYVGMLIRYKTHAQLMRLWKYPKDTVLPCYEEFVQWNVTLLLLKIAYINICTKTAYQSLPFHYASETYEKYRYC